MPALRSGRRAWLFSKGICPQTGADISADSPDKSRSISSTDTETMDKINYRYGRNTIFTAGEGIKRPWSMKQEFLSRRFTTNWNEILEIR